MAADWDDLDADVARIAREDAFSARTIAQIGEFLDLVRYRCPIPAVSKGYWNTLRVSWGGIEIEIWDDHLELYRFCDGRTDIRHFARIPGSPFPAELVAALPSTIAGGSHVQP